MFASSVYMNTVERRGLKTSAQIRSATILIAERFLSQHYEYMLCTKKNSLLNDRFVRKPTVRARRLSHASSVYGPDAVHFFRFINVGFLLFSNRVSLLMISKK